VADLGGMYRTSARAWSVQNVRPPGAPVHRSTASAWNRRDGGIVRPKAWAVVRLMTSVKGLGGSTDRLSLVV
jgi:hypothetical protein